MNDPQFAISKLRKYIIDHRLHSTEWFFVLPDGSFKCKFQVVFPEPKPSHTITVNGYDRHSKRGALAHVSRIFFNELCMDMKYLEPVH